MAWPDDRDLPIEVEAAFGADLDADPAMWTWTDLSSRLLNDRIRIQYGSRSNASRVSPASCSVTLDNGDGALTPLHPMSPYYPDVELGTPVRVRLRRADDTFGRTVAGGWGTSDSGQAWTTSGTSHSVSSGHAVQSHATVNTIRWALLDVSLLDVEQLVDVTVPALLTGGAFVFGFEARAVDADNCYVLRYECDAGGTSVTLKLTKREAGSSTDLAVLATHPTVTYAANTPTRVRASVVGSQLAIKVWRAADPEPAGWDLTVTDSTYASPGKCGIQSFLTSTNTNTLPFAPTYDNYTAVIDRFSGIADQWQPTFYPTTDGGFESTVRVTASGILRRLGQGTEVSRSALNRSITATPDLLAYWSLEDGEFSTSAASAVLGNNPMTPVGTVEFAALDPDDLTGGQIRGGSGRLPDLTHGGLVGGTSPAGTGSPVAWTVQWMARGGTATLPSEIVLLSWAAGGRLWEVVLTGPPNFNTLLRVNGVVVVEDGTTFDGFFEWRVTAVQSGADVSVQLTIDGGTQGDVTPGGSPPWTATIAGYTLGWPDDLASNPTAASTGDEVNYLGHIQVWDDDGTAVPWWGPRLFGGFIPTNAAYAYHAELATVRLARLVAEDGVALAMPSVAAEDDTPMGFQPTGGALELYQECETVDGGVLHEDRFGLGYLPRVVRYNRTPTLTIDLSTYRIISDDAESVVAPVYDDQGLVNQFTAERSLGSSFTAADIGHQRRGRYTGGDEFNLATDDLLADRAEWGIHLGTVVELRDGTIPLDLAANPGLVDAWLACGLGSVMRRTNLPAQYPDNVVDRIVEGWAETIGPRSWQAQIVVSPAGPWTVAEVDGEPRVAADASFLAAPVAVDDTTLLIAPIGEEWTTDAADLPVDILLGGERMTATAITARVAPSYVATGTATNGNNTNRTPALPVGWAQGDLLLIYATARATPDHRPVAPDSYLTLFQDRNIALFGKLAGASESDPTVTFVGGVTGSDTIAQMAAFRGVAPGVMASAGQLNATAQDIATPALAVPQPALIIHLGWKQDDWTSVSVPAGTTLVGSRNATLGDDAAQVWAYTIQTTQADIPAGAFGVTGGATAVSRGAVVALWAGVQQMTVTRGVNGIHKPHPTASGVT